MSDTKRAYFGIDSLLLNLILWFFLGGFLGVIQAFIRGNILWGIVRAIAVLLVVTYPIFWIIDLISFIVHKDLKWLI